MLKSNYQPQLLDPAALTLDAPDADISYHPHFIEEANSWPAFEVLLQETQWQQETITLYGKQHQVPRLSCWMADAGLDYSYSNMTMEPVPWTELMLKIKSDLENRLNVTFNSVLINYYRDGQDSNGWHADNEPELGQNPIIASLSLGGARDFKLRHRQNKKLKHSIKLKHGSLLLMKGTTQAYWQHQIPKRAKAEPRINLTFRTIKL